MARDRNRQCYQVIRKTLAIRSHAVINSQHRGSMTSALRTKVIDGLQRLLVPVVRLCVTFSVQLGDVIEILKSVYVQEALQQVGDKASLSRISAMTGVHRKDVTRLVREPSPPKERVNLFARIMTHWQHSEPFRTVRGQPRVLTCEGRDSEFAQLVRDVTGGDLSTYSILHEMERRGIVTRDKSKVRLVWKDFVVSGDVAEGLNLLAEDSSDLAAAVSENLFASDKLPIKNLHLRTEFDKVDPARLPEIREWLLREGSYFHARVREYLSKCDRDSNPDCNTTGQAVRISVGAFSYVETGNERE